MDIKIDKNKRKVRVNITVDKDLLDKSKKKLKLFGGKLSTLINSYMNDFVESIDKNFEGERKQHQQRIDELEERIKKLEKNKK